MSLLVLIVSLYGFLIARRLFRSYYSPLGVLSLVWGLSLLLVCVTSPTTQPFHSVTWVAILSSWLVFLVGSMTSLYARSCLGKSKPLTSDLILPDRYKDFVVVLGIVSLIGSIRLAIVILDVVGVDLFLTDKLEVRTLLTVSDEHSTGKLSLVFEGATYVSALFSGVYLSARRRFVWCYLPLLAAVIHDLFFIGRAHTIYTTVLFLSAFVCSHTGRKIFSLKGLQNMLPALILPLALFLIPVVYVGQYRSTIERDTWLPQNVLRVAQIAQNWYALDHVLQNPPDRAWGVNSFFFAVRTLNLLGFTDDDPRLKSLAQEEVQMPDGGTNKYTVISDIFADFGPLGIIFFFYLFGLLSTFVFGLYQTEKKLWQVTALPFIYTELVFSLSGNALSGYAFVFGFLGVTALSFAVDRWGRHQSSLIRDRLYRSA